MKAAAGSMGYRAIEDKVLYPPQLLQTRIERLGLAGVTFQYALLPAFDPSRVRRIASLLRGARKLIEKDGDLVYLGRLGRANVITLNTGIGSANTALTVETLVHAGAKFLIRVGSAGALQPHLTTGDLLIATGAIRNDGASHEYVRAEYPAAAEPLLLGALFAAAKRLAPRLHLTYRPGIIWSHEAFFAESRRLIRRWSHARVVGVEMETATLLTLASLRHVAAASLLTVTDNMLRGRRRGSPFTTPAQARKFEMGVEKALTVAAEAVRLHQRLLRRQ